MKTAEAFVKSLENENVEFVFGLAGEENLEVLEALKNSDKIRFIPVRHEQAAGFMAATVGRLTGIPGVALSTLGPGATNLVTASAYAQLGAMPLLLVTGQKPLRFNKQGSFQLIDVVDMMTPLTKYSKQLVEGSAVSSTVREAVRIATLERPGAAHVEIPKDVAANEINYKPFKISETRRPIAENKAIKWAVEMLVGAQRPLLFIGAGANRKRTSNMLTEFITTYNMPFVTTQMGKGVVDESLLQYGGTAALSNGDYIHDTIKQADIIVMAGYDVVEKPPFPIDESQKIIHINFESASVNDAYYPDIEVVGDIANAVWQIKEALKEKENQISWDTDFHKVAVAKSIDQFNTAVSTSETILPQVVVHEVRSAVPDDGIVALDNGMYKLWFARHYTTKYENTLLLDNALATMGAGLPSAIAAKLINPDKVVVAVVGDGGFMMNSQELETAVRLKLDLTVLILNDNKFQMIRWEQSAKGYEDFGLSFNNPDFKMLAESYGAVGHVAHDPGELTAALKESTRAHGVHIIDVRIDYSRNASELKVAH